MLNVNSAIYSSAGIDVNSAAKVSSQILKEASANAQPTVQAIDYSKFNRATLGIDLYSSRTNVDLQKQIALTQAGLYMNGIFEHVLSVFILYIRILHGDKGGHYGGVAPYGKVKSADFQRLWLSVIIPHTLLGINQHAVPVF